MYNSPGFAARAARGGPPGAPQAKSLPRFAGYSGSPAVRTATACNSANTSSSVMPGATICLARSCIARVQAIAFFISSSSSRSLRRRSCHRSSSIRRSLDELRKEHTAELSIPTRYVSGHSSSSCRATTAGWPCRWVPNQLDSKTVRSSAATGDCGSFPQTSRERPLAKRTNAASCNQNGR
jgi:hypothetical protein